jgi:predicted amidophosphoribosyltransferase
MHPAALLRERRELMRAREATIRDIGGLALEMRRRERWKDRLLQARCDEALEIERRVAEVDSLLAAVTVARAAPGAARCKCGAPVPAGAHFCSHCGRPAPATPPVVSCSRCGQPVPAEANFCAFCGNPVAAEEYEGPVDAVDDTLARRRSDVED